MGFSGTGQVGLKGSLASQAPGVTPASGDTARFSYHANGTTWDPVTNNQSATLLASAARTTQGGSSQQTNYNARAITLALNITAAPNTGETLTIWFFPYDVASGGDGSQAIASYASDAGSTLPTGAIYRLFVGLGASGTPDTRCKSYALPVPRLWRAAVNPSAGSSWTYSLGVAYSV